ncbi:serine hydrolase domain-containing protein [Mycolicibacterium diernhoferi]|uniref:Hydrolase n=1 Tax=Mycolicibacterium diernhoferi TaxID=1801 RepID=A0A1Q4HJQ7_9MYCO|nr:serine hydrolase [Mycolicibacterium diernhoferi]OJZ67776.1 hydrolase [Mycolicibacterium diernhoferi]OPE54450.1 hydrolase [Mycolicibacterium diernhoferi]PEG51874.1 hydrolase [Mycolicibacterium diernhoferi]QYL20423.1 beta-lactamase family protein [Mycolicibacterium diernhoferi]
MSSPPAGISLANWLSEPYAHWAFQHVDDFVPTAVISRGTGPVAALDPADTPLGDIRLTDSTGAPTTVGAVLAGTATDGWALAARGSLLAEDYFEGFTPHTRHLLFSVSKSLIGAVVGVLHGHGAIELDAPVTTYVPALAHCGYAGATVRHLLDMRSGIAFSDNYLHPTAEIHLLDQAVGWAPRTSPDAPSSLYDFLLTLRQKTAHGGPFEYRSCETDALGWICEIASGRRMPALMSELLWSHIGARSDATIGVDADGTGFFDGGVSACLTDLIRFGSLFLHDGVSLTGQQVVPAAWIADTLAGGPDSRQAFDAGPGENPMPGGMYRNQVWFPRAGNNVVLCQGMRGQLVYVNRSAGIVAAKVSTQQDAGDAQMLLDTLRAFDAVADEFG